jgi:hypothetical protein
MLQIPPQPVCYLLKPYYVTFREIVNLMKLSKRLVGSVRQQGQARGTMTQIGTKLQARATALWTRYCCRL